MTMIKKVNWYMQNVNALVTNDPLTKNDKIATQCFKNAKKTLAKFLQAKPSEVLYSTGSTESLNFIANLLYDELKPGDEIVIHYMEHGSNLLP
ncbi:aminotransferase class V-fold PLP-dependent enzyme [bacterium]|nr:aminotransferase class V-fold PLP-dependent enzyme [bacterium]MBP5783940.1 aminotransferase class V-fold PLP-dependent enzyme [bacterium]